MIQRIDLIESRRVGRTSVRTPGLLLFVILAVACGGESGAPTTPVGPSGPPASITMIPRSKDVAFIGAVLRFRARVTDEGGRSVETPVTWRSTTPDIISVDASGTVTALADGVGTVEASVGSVSGTATVTVAHSPCLHVDTDVLVDLEVGETLRIDSRAACVRIVGRDPRSFYSVGMLERSFIEASVEAAEPREGTYDYGVGDYESFVVNVHDLGSGPVSNYVVPTVPPLARSSARIGPRRPHIERSDPQADGFDPYSMPPLAVGDEFEYWTDEEPERTGPYQVVALYPPNVAFAVFKEDLRTVWGPRQGEWRTMFERLASEKAQSLYQAWFGPNPPISSHESNQLLVLHHDNEPGRTGVMFHGPDDHTLVHVFINHWSPCDDFSWYTGLAAHEFAHAWQYRNLARVSSQWSTEGLANSFANEELRRWMDWPRATQLTDTRTGLCWDVGLPFHGNFVWGYDESDSFIRYLVNQLIDVHGQSYEVAAEAVIHGVAEGWHGYHYPSLNDPGVLRGEGLTARMNEIAPGWDPVEARLDWMAAFGADDHSELPVYSLPFVREARTTFAPLFHITLGEREDTPSPWAYRGGTEYALLDNPSGLNATVRLTALDEAAMSWKILRYR